MEEGREKYRKRDEEEEKGGRVEKKWFKEKRGGDDYIHLYIHHTGYEREHEVLKPDPKMAVHKLSLQAKQKTVMAPNKYETKHLGADGILFSAAACVSIQQTSGAFWRWTHINKNGWMQSERG